MKKPEPLVNIETEHKLKKDGNYNYDYGVINRLLEKYKPSNSSNVINSNNKPLEQTGGI